MDSSSSTSLLPGETRPWCGTASSNDGPDGEPTPTGGPHTIHVRHVALTATRRPSRTRRPSFPRCPGPAPLRRVAYTNSHRRWMRLAGESSTRMEQARRGLAWTGDRREGISDLGPLPGLRSSAGSVVGTTEWGAPGSGSPASGPVQLSPPVRDVRGHEKVPTGGQNEVPTGGQVEVPTSR